MGLDKIDVITSNSYGFRVFDWDNNRGGRDGAGKALVGKVDLKVDDGKAHLEFMIYS